MHFKFRQLQAFRAVVTTGSTQEAANQLFVTQPAISRLIKDLENELCFMLFDRSKGKLIPTEQGLAFFNALEVHFLGLERLTHVAQAIKESANKKLTLACSPVLSMTVLPACIKAINKSYPKLNIEIHSTELSNIRSMLQSGVVDMALCVAFDMPAGVVSQTLGRAQAVCAMPEQHHLASKEVIQLSDLNDETMIEWLPISPFMPSDEYELLKQNQVMTNSYLKTQTAHTRYALISAGLGISIAEPLSAKFWQAHGVVTRPLIPTVSFEYELAYQKSLQHSVLIQKITHIIKQTYTQYAQ